MKVFLIVSSVTLSHSQHSQLHLAELQFRHSEHQQILYKIQNLLCLVTVGCRCPADRMTVDLLKSKKFYIFLTADKLHGCFQLITSGVKQHHNILPLKCLKIPWIISISKRTGSQVLLNTSRQKISLNQFQHVGMSIQAHLRQSMLVCCISQSTSMEVGDNMWHSHKPPLFLLLFLPLNNFEFSVGKTKP